MKTVLLLCFVSLSFRLAHAQSAAPAATGPDTPSVSYIRANRFLLTSYVALSAADAWKTEQNLSTDPRLYHHHEENPVMPGSTAGRALYFAGTTSAVVGASWLADHYGHPKLARRILQVGSLVEVQANFRSWTGL